MSVHVLLNLFNELGNKNKMRGLPSILFLFRANDRFYLSYDIKRILKSYFWRESVMVLPYA